MQNFHFHLPAGFSLSDTGADLTHPLDVLGKTEDKRLYPRLYLLIGLAMPHERPDCKDLTTSFSPIN